MNKEIARLFASKFIARPDVKAEQLEGGEYRPVVKRDKTGKIIETYPFKMADLLAHLEGSATYGHYMLNHDNQCKYFAFDIDINEKGWVPFAVNEHGEWTDFHYREDLRVLWTQRSQVIVRKFFKSQMKLLANKLTRVIYDEFEIPVAVAYSGSKGVHVYGFTGLLPAEQVRDGAELVLKAAGCFERSKGMSVYRHKTIHTGVTDQAGNPIEDHELSFSQFSIEIYPKQTKIEPGGFGNLMRLPLGKNLKNPKDPTFFLDLRKDFGEGAFSPRDPIEALTVPNPWKD